MRVKLGKEVLFLNQQYRKFISVALLCLLVVISVHLWNSRDKVDPIMPDGVYTATERGFSSDVKVTVTVSGGKITSIDVEHNDTPSIADPAIEQVVANIIETQSADVDTVTYATLSTRAVINGVKKIITQHQPASEETTAKALLPDGVYTGTSRGFKSDLELTVTVSGGKIVSIDVVHDDTPGIADLAIDQVIPKIIETQSVDVDTATYATITSQGIIEGVKNIIEANQ